MVAEQVTRSRYRVSSGSLREIQMAARLETPGEPGVDVNTELTFTETFAPPWDELVVAQLYEGVHAGLAAAGLPLPESGIRVEIMDLVVSPPLPSDPSQIERQAIGSTIRALAASTVEALWVGLNQPEAPADEIGSSR